MPNDTNFKLEITRKFSFWFGFFYVCFVGLNNSGVIHFSDYYFWANHLVYLAWPINYAGLVCL